MLFYPPAPHNGLIHDSSPYLYDYNKTNSAAIHILRSLFYLIEQLYTIITIHVTSCGRCNLRSARIRTDASLARPSVRGSRCHSRPHRIILKYQIFINLSQSQTSTSTKAKPIPLKYLSQKAGYNNDLRRFYSSCSIFEYRLSRKLRTVLSVQNSLNFRIT